MKNIDQESKDLLKRLSDDENVLVEAIKLETKSCIEKLKSTKEGLYGYAILPGDYFEVGSLVAAYNFESDIKVSEEAGPIYYRYSVDEWLNYDHDALPKSNDILKNHKLFLEKLCDLYEEEYDEETTELQSKFADFIYESTLKALIQFREETVGQDHQLFLVIWVSDSSNEITEQSVLKLNSPSVANLFCSEFS
jgi:Domain of unknown function (DUF4303)